MNRVKQYAFGGVSQLRLPQLVLAVAFLASVMACAVPATVLAAQVTHTYSPSSQTIAQGTTFTMSITTNAGTAHVLEDKLRVLYDPGKLQLVSVSYDGSPLNENTGKIPTGSGFLQIYRTNKLSHPGGNFLLATITFKALVGSGSVSVGYDAANSAVINQDDGKNVLVGVNGATYTFSPPPDPTPPTIKITEPPADATVAGQLSVIAEAADNTGITKVDFAIDGKTLSSDTSAPYSALIDTTSLTNGPHQITATVVDTGGNQVSAVQTIQVNNTAEGGAATTTPAKSQAQQSQASRSPLALLGGVIGAIGLTMFAISVLQMIKRRRQVTAITMRRPMAQPLPKGAVPYDPSAAAYLPHQAPLSPANIPQGTRVIPTDQNDGTHPR